MWSQPRVLQLPQFDVDDASSARRRSGEMMEFACVAAEVVTRDNALGLYTGQSEPGTTLQWPPLKMYLSRGGSGRGMGSHRRAGMVKLSPTFSQPLVEDPQEQFVGRWRRLGSTLGHDLSKCPWLQGSCQSVIGCQQRIAAKWRVCPGFAASRERSGLPSRTTKHTEPRSWLTSTHWAA